MQAALCSVRHIKRSCATAWRQLPRRAGAAHHEVTAALNNSRAGKRVAAVATTSSTAQAVAVRCCRHSTTSPWQLQLQTVSAAMLAIKGVVAMAAVALEEQQQQQAALLHATVRLTAASLQRSMSPIRTAGDLTAAAAAVQE